MENKPELKKFILRVLIVIVAVLAVFILSIMAIFKKYNKNNNTAIAKILLQVTEKYPDISQNELMEILDTGNAKHDNDGNKDHDTGYNDEVIRKFYAQYGIDLERDYVADDNKDFCRNILFVCILFVVAEAAAIWICFFLYDRKRDRDISEITKCIENINKKIYHIDIDSNTEDELSILKNEVYKTTVMLKEDAENAKLSKAKLKDSLSDISHQLKTPLTAITIKLDNLMEEPDMEEKTRRKFIREIRREISNINFLVQSLLKLSRLEADTVNFNNEETKLSDLVSEAMENVAALSDLRGVSINVIADEQIKENCKIICDRKWQIEAISNILKNSVEHSMEGSHVDIEMSANHVYTSLKIINYGETISKQDLPHIFERFYQGENATSGSVGIGLSLAKSIIESCSGQVYVDSFEGKTSFHIKYF